MITANLSGHESINGTLRMDKRVYALIKTPEAHASQVIVTRSTRQGGSRRVDEACIRISRSDETIDQRRPQRLRHSKFTLRLLRRIPTPQQCFSKSDEVVPRRKGRKLNKLKICFRWDPQQRGNLMTYRAWASLCLTAGIYRATSISFPTNRRGVIRNSISRYATTRQTEIGQTARGWPRVTSVMVDISF